MKRSVNYSDFVDAFEKMDRGNQFSRKGLSALFDHLEEYEEETGEEIELDVIALCCEFTEFENLPALQEEYSDIETMEDLENKTQVVMIPDTDGFIIVNY